MTAVNAPIDMEAFQNAIHDWFSGSTGLQTIWRNQSAPQPEHPFGSLMILSGPEQYSPAWEERDETDTGRPLGEEIKQTVTVPCRFVVSCQAYVEQVDARNPNHDAASYINKAKGALGLSSYLQDLNTANVSVSTVGPVQNLTALLESEMESRANMDVVFSSVLSLDEYVGYIEKVHATSTELGIDQVFGVGEVI
jgi:hypothetical protein